MTEFIKDPNAIDENVPEDATSLRQEIFLLGEHLTAAETRLDVLSQCCDTYGAAAEDDRSALSADVYRLLEILGDGIAECEEQLKRINEKSEAAASAIADTTWLLSRRAGAAW